jgi:hypothetical protein
MLRLCSGKHKVELQSDQRYPKQARDPNLDHVTECQDFLVCTASVTVLRLRQNRSLRKADTFTHFETAISTARSHGIPFD